MISLTLAVIRVYGVFTYTQFHERQFWDSLSQQLQQRGSDYIERCTFRDQCTSDGVTLPAFFPPSPLRVRDIPQATPLVKVCEEDMKDVSELTDMCLMHWLNAYAIDPFHACVCPFQRQTSSQLTQQITSLEKFFMLSQVTSSSISA